MARGDAFLCPFCSGQRICVKKTLPQKTFVHRWRKCLDCKGVFETEEVFETWTTADGRTVVNHDALDHGYVTKKQACKILRLKPRHLVRLIEDGVIKTKLGLYNSLQIDRKSVDDYRDQAKARAAAATAAMIQEIETAKAAKKKRARLIELVPEAAFATDAPPGSAAKVNVMADRAAQRVSLFHPEDNSTWAMESMLKRLAKLR